MISLGAILDDEALALAGTPHLRFDRQDNGVEIGPLASCPHPQRRGDVHPTQPDVDPIGRNGIAMRPLRQKSSRFRGRGALVASQSRGSSAD